MQSRKINRSEMLTQCFDVNKFHMVYKVALQSFAM